MGNALIGELTEATGLPKELVDSELGRLIDASGKIRDDVTLDDLRVILAEYVQDVLLAAKEAHEAEEFPEDAKAL
ncbi:MAG: hypothetical protein V4760_07555 [Bdellovibrionota bacterium]